MKNMLQTPQLSAPSMAPTVGEHSEKVLSDVLGYDATKFADLKGKGAFGNK